MAAPPTPTSNVDEIFTNSQWKAQADQPGALEQLGHKWDATLATKGQALKTYLEDQYLRQNLRTW